MQSTLTQAAKATPSRATSGTATDKPATPAAEPGFAQQWGQLSLVLDATQREMRADSPWLVRLRTVQDLERFGSTPRGVMRRSTT